MHRFSAALSIAIVCMLLSPWALAANEGAGKPKDKHSPTVTLRGGINQLLVLCGAAGLTLSANSLPATIEKVRLGSGASYAGIRAGDKINAGQVNNDILTLSLERNGKKFQAKLATDPKSLKAMISTILPKAEEKVEPTPVDGNHRKITGFLTEQQSDQVLTNYEVVILIDRSGSMSAGIDPSIMPHEIAGLREGGGPPIDTKWSWCQSQVTNLSDSILGKYKKRVTIIPFDDKYDIIRSASMTEVQDVFTKYGPRGGTDLGAPLQKALEMPARPLLVAIVTDGMYNMGPSVENIIISATNNIGKLGDIVITFLQVGDEPGGFDKISMLDKHLMAQGARFDIVDATYFVDLKVVGLKRALATAVRDKTLGVKK